MYDTYEQETSVCMCCTVANKKYKVCLKNFRILLILSLSVNGEIHNAYSLYIIKNTGTIVARGNFTKVVNNF